MTRTEQASFIERRARASATVLLLSRDDLMILDVPRGAGVDMLVTVVKKRAIPSRQFGVILKGTTNRLRSPRAASRELNALMKGTEPDDTSIPLCVFFFNMTGNDGFYAWRDEPTLVGGMPKLAHRSPMACEVLDEEALREMVGRVDAYYDALARALAV